jgi:hypothetical protein
MTPDELKQAGFSDEEIQGYLARKTQSADSPIVSGLKQALAGTIEGSAGLGGLVTDAVTAAMKGTKYLPMVGDLAEKQLQDLDLNKPFGYYTKSMQELVNNPDAVGTAVPELLADKPQGMGEHFLRSVGEFAPAALGGPGTLATKLGAALLGAGGHTLAREVAPESDTLDLVASVGAPSLPQIVKGGFNSIKGALNVLPSQIEGKVGQVVKGTGVTLPELERAAAVKTSGDLFDRASTTAELTANPRLSSLESTAMRANPGEAAALEAQKRGAFTQTLDNITERPTIPEQQLGEKVASKVSDKYFSARDAGGKLFDAIDPEGTTAIPVQGIARRLKAEASQLGNPEVGSYLSANSKAREFIRNFLTDAKPKGQGATKFTFEKLRRARSDAQELAEELQAAGRKRDARVLKQFVQSIDSTVASAAKKGIGFTEEQAARWKKANNFWKKEVVALEESPVIGGSIIQGRTEAEFLPKKLMSASTDTLKTIRKSLSPTEIKELRANLFDKIRWDMTSATGRPTLAATQSALSKNNRVIKTFFEPKHLRDLNRIESVLTREATIKELGGAASRGNSITAQSLTNIDALKKFALEGALDNVPGVGGVLRTLRNHVTNPKQAELIMNEAILKVAMDPKYAARLLRRANQGDIITLIEDLGVALSDKKFLQSALTSAQGAAVSGGLGE